MFDAADDGLPLFVLSIPKRLDACYAAAMATPPPLCYAASVTRLMRYYASAMMSATLRCATSVIRHADDALFEMKMRIAAAP